MTTTMTDDQARDLADTISTLEAKLRRHGDGSRSSTYEENAEAREGVKAEIMDMADGLGTTLDMQSYLWPATRQGQAMTRAEMTIAGEHADLYGGVLSKLPTRGMSWSPTGPTQRLHDVVTRLKREAQEALSNERRRREQMMIANIVTLIEDGVREDDPVAGAYREGMMIAFERIRRIDETRDGQYRGYRRWDSEDVWAKVAERFRDRAEFAAEFKPANRIERAGVEGLVDEYLERRGGRGTAEGIGVQLGIPKAWVSVALTSLEEADRVQISSYGRRGRTGNAYIHYTPAQRQADEAAKAARDNVVAAAEGALARRLGDDWEEHAAVKYNGDVVIEGSLLLELLARESELARLKPVLEDYQDADDRRHAATTEGDNS